MMLGLSLTLVLGLHFSSSRETLDVQVQLEAGFFPSQEKVWNLISESSQVRII